MSVSLREITGRALHQVPTRLWRRLFPKIELGVCYHMVAHAKPPHVQHYPVLTPAEFESDLSYLRQQFGFTSYNELVDRRASRHPARDNKVILTFDDGFAECSTVVAPILRQQRIDCVFFIITDLIDNTTLFRESEASLCIDAIRRMPAGQVSAIVDELGLASHLRPPPYALADASPTPLRVAGLDCTTDPQLWPLLHWLLGVAGKDAASLRRLSARLGIDVRDYLARVGPYHTAAQIQQLRADGFTIGAHSCSHRWLQDLPPDEAEHEIVESCRIVRDITGQRTVPFAFPYFGGGIDRTWLADIRKRHDFVGLFFDTDGLREDAPFVVQRVFGERFSNDRTLDAVLRRAWSRRPSWYWRT